LTQKGLKSAKGGHAQQKEESVPLNIGERGREAFQELKNSFLLIPILTHFERNRETRVEVDALGGAISAILSQLLPERGRKPQWRPTDFFSRKLNKTQYAYNVHDKELLTIVESLDHWRHLLDRITF